MSTYASKTTVSPEKSRAEIERTLIRYGADGFAYGWEGRKTMVQFKMSGRHIRLTMEMPDRNERRFTHHARGARTPASAEKEYDQATRQRWRALALLVKAKLEAVESGISTLEHEFMADTVMPNGQTVAETALPMIEEAYETGDMPRLLPA